MGSSPSLTVVGQLLLSPVFHFIMGKSSIQNLLGKDHILQVIQSPDQVTCGWGLHALHDKAGEEQKTIAKVWGHFTGHARLRDVEDWCIYFQSCAQSNTPIPTCCAHIHPSHVGFPMEFVIDFRYFWPYCSSVTTSLVRWRLKGHLNNKLLQLPRLSLKSGSADLVCLTQHTQIRDKTLVMLVFRDLLFSWKENHQTYCLPSWIKWISGEI